MRPPYSNRIGESSRAAPTNRETEKRQKQENSILPAEVTGTSLEIAGRLPIFFTSHDRGFPTKLSTGFFPPQELTPLVSAFFANGIIKSSHGGSYAPKMEI